MFGNNVIIDIESDSDSNKTNNNNNNKTNNTKSIFGNNIIIDNEHEFIKKDEKSFIYNKNNSKMANIPIKDKIKTNNYSKPSNLLFNNGKNMSSQSKALILSDISDDEYYRRLQIFKNLRNIVLPEQRTNEWFEMRNNKITASDTGTVLNENKHEAQYMFIFNKVFGKVFESNSFCYHGKKFENVVKLIYEFDNDCIVDEFGLLSHPLYSFLGASPDGICNGLKRDGISKSNLVGRMIEIKVPKVRKIKFDGDVKGDITPDYYWCQMQQQLECCDLDECDFTQCTIEEYVNRQEYLDDTNSDSNYLSKRYNKYKGLIIEYLPRNLSTSDYDSNNNISDSTIFDKALFFYPPKLDMTLTDLDNWVLLEKSKLDNNPNFMFHRVVYWKLLEINYTLVPRDKLWFAKILPTLDKIWSYVLFLRNNTTAANEWQQFINSLSSKVNSKIIAKIDYLINVYSNNLNIDLFMNSHTPLISDSTTSSIIPSDTTNTLHSSILSESSIITQTSDNKNIINNKNNKEKKDSNDKKINKDKKDSKDIKNNKEKKDSKDKKNNKEKKDSKDKKEEREERQKKEESEEKEEREDRSDIEKREEREEKEEKDRGDIEGGGIEEVKKKRRYMRKKILN
jgi:putative phage-type endonuclease